MASLTKRSAKKNLDGSWTIEITPLAMSKVVKHVNLTEDQYKRYQQWERGEIMIQHAFPELSRSTRELFLTGLDDAEFAKACGPEED